MCYGRGYFEEVWLKSLISRLSTGRVLVGIHRWHCDVACFWIVSRAAEI